MTYIKKVTIRCDGDVFQSGMDCKESYGEESTYQTIKAVREDAHELGWVTRGEDDYCPYCK